MKKTIFMAFLLLAVSAHAQTFYSVEEIIRVALSRLQPRMAPK